MKRLIIVFIVLCLSALTVNNAWGMSTLYMVQERIGQDDLLLKYESGSLITVGSIGFSDVRGLAYDATSETLFGVSRASNRLIIVDIGTGVGTAVGDNLYLPHGSNTAEISTRMDGELFGIGHLYDMYTNDTLLDVDELTGIATPISEMGEEMCGLAFDHHTDTLYGSSYYGELYTIDPNSGVATFLGNITGTDGTVARITFDQSDGVLYGITTSRQLVTIDIPNLVGTEVVKFPGFQIYALDFQSQVPEPTTIALLGLGGLMIRRSNNKRE